MICDEEKLITTGLLEKFSDQDIAPNEVTYVGDALIDYKSAEGAGFDFIGITTGMSSCEQFEEAGVLVIIDDIKHLPDQLKK